MIHNTDTTQATQPTKNPTKRPKDNLEWFSIKESTIWITQGSSKAPKLNKCEHVAKNEDTMADETASALLMFGSRVRSGPRA